MAWRWPFVSRRRHNKVVGGLFSDCRRHKARADHFEADNLLLSNRLLGVKSLQMECAFSARPRVQDLVLFYRIEVCPQSFRYAFPADSALGEALRGDGTAVAVGYIVGEWARKMQIDLTQQIWEQLRLHGPKTTTCPDE